MHVPMLQRSKKPRDHASQDVCKLTVPNVQTANLSRDAPYSSASVVACTLCQLSFCLAMHMGIESWVNAAALIGGYIDQKLPNAAGY
jgi:hypothetical protein